jgi:isopentenyl phosphate kinase
MILIKLGGSIITNKEKPESARRKTIDNILKQIKKVNEPMILVHGGGSYGHYWSVKYGIIQFERTLSSKKLHDRTGQNYLGQRSKKQTKHILYATY